MVLIKAAIVTAIIGKVVVLGFDYLIAGCKWECGGIQAELRSLNKALPRIQAGVEAVESAREHITPSSPLGLWLQQLKDAVYEADDVIDDLEYVRLEQQVLSSAEASSKNKVCGIVTSHFKQNVIPFSRRVFKYNPTLKKLREVIKSLNEVALSDFLNTVEAKKHHQEARNIGSRKTGPLLTESIVLGRDEEQETLLKWLKMDPVEQGQKEEGNSNHNNVSLFSIVGHGGMGKTTLAQLVFNDQSIQSSFEPKIWVCVSTSSDVEVLTAAMLESATGVKPEISILSTLQEALKKKLKSSNKKFLLVLDDAWDKIHDWPTLLAPLRYGSKGSKILLTTRMNQVAESVAQAIGAAKESMKLESIENDAFFKLFNQCAFAGEKPDDYPRLRFVGKQIAKKLGGSPLAAKVLGALLNQNLDELYWNNILHTNFLDHTSEHGEVNIKSILMLSYYSLPVHLRSCFVYCSTFPQDYMFEKEALVHMWIAVRLIQQTPQNPRDVLEDVGSLYFEELVKRSFLEPHHHIDEMFVMHDLLHELARSVSNDECFSFVDDELEKDFPSTILHLYLETNNINLLAKVNKLKNLRTFVFNLTGKSDSSMDSLHVPSWVKNLVIKGYGGCRSANWMEMETTLREKQVEYVELNECSRWEQLPPFKMLQYLKHLKLEKMPVVKKIDFSEDGYAQLGVLKIAEMEQLEEWSLADSTSKVEINQWCPRLEKLKVALSYKYCLHFPLA